MTDAFVISLFIAFYMGFNNHHKNFKFSGKNLSEYFKELVGTDDSVNEDIIDTLIKDTMVERDLLRLDWRKVTLFRPNLHLTHASISFAMCSERGIDMDVDLRYENDNFSLTLIPRSKGKDKPILSYNTNLVTQQISVMVDKVNIQKYWYEVLDGLEYVQLSDVLDTNKNLCNDIRDLRNFIMQVGRTPAKILTVEKPLTP